MYKFILMNGRVLEWNEGIRLRTLKKIAENSVKVFQIVRDNRDQEVVWERECVKA